MSKKCQQQIQELVVEPLYYYEDVITVCLLKRGKEVLARGVAICSPIDQFVKKVGRMKALGMALRALVQHRSSGDIRPGRFIGRPSQHIHPLWKAEKFQRRSDYEPELTDRELYIVAKAK